MLCEEDALDSGKRKICLIWTCRNAVTMEVTRYQIQAVRITDGDFDTADKEKILTWSVETAELKAELRQGEYTFRTRALNIVGPGAWSLPLQLVLQDDNVSDAVQREESKAMLRKAREFARRNQQEEARAKVLSNMSTLASRHSHAYENLKAALSDARRVCVSSNVGAFGVITEEDRSLFERAEKKLNEMLLMEEARQNMKVRLVLPSRIVIVRLRESLTQAAGRQTHSRTHDFFQDWKKKILPFPAADLLDSTDSAEVSGAGKCNQFLHLRPQLPYIYTYVYIHTYIIRMLPTHKHR
jgi:hypothetical protein